MKINIIIAGLFKSGGMRAIFEYANMFTDMGHDVVVYRPIIPYKNGNETYVIIIKKYIKRFLNFIFKNKEKLNYYTAKFEIRLVPFIHNIFIRNADATIATQWPTAFSIYKLNHSKGTKNYFIQGYETWSSDPAIVDKSYVLPLKRITTSKYLHILLKEKFNVQSKVIPIGLDFTLFNNKNKKYNSVKNITFIDSDNKVKDVESALYVVKEIEKAYNNVRFTAFGFKKYHEMPKFINFIENPNDEQIKNIYCDTDIFIFSSITDGFGLPPAEAMACKCAVVTTRVGAVPEYSENNVTAILVTPGDRQELLNGVRYLLDNHELIEKLSENSYLRVSEFFDWEKSAHEFLKEITRLH